MSYTNSSLVSKTVLSPNHSGTRTHAIDTITIHCFVGQVTVDRGLSVFANSSSQSSCNYVIGYDGKIGLCVEEENRSWCTSSRSNDQRAITIEVASDTKHPYKVNDKAYAALLDLVTDICKRNNIKELKWKADKSLIGQPDKQNITVHRWFANKACPGDYLYERHGEIAAEVNKRLGVAGTEKESNGAAIDTGDLVSIVSGAKYYTGKAVPSWVQQKKWYIASVSGDRAVLGKSEDSKNNIQSAINTKYLTVVKDVATKTEDTFKSYKVKVTANTLNIRKGPGTNYGLNGSIRDKGIYTIVAEQSGKGSKKGWAKLKSGVGWISLDYCTKV